MNVYKFCPNCSKPLVAKIVKELERQVCTDTENCGFVHWDNPIPVVAAVVECETDIILVQSIGWPKHFYGLVTGFLEKDEEVEKAACREVEEELGLEVLESNFIGIYPPFRNNQIIIAYHVKVKDGTIQLDTSELAAYKRVPLAKIRPWKYSTGLALNDWLKSKGIERAFMEF